MIISSFTDKTVADKEREGHLIDQWVSLTEERNNILCPTPGSGVPGAPLDWYHTFSYFVCFSSYYEISIFDVQLLIFDINI